MIPCFDVILCHIFAENDLLFEKYGPTLWEPCVMCLASMEDIWNLRLGPTERRRKRMKQGRNREAARPFRVQG